MDDDDLDYLLGLGGDGTGQKETDMPLEHNQPKDNLPANAANWSESLLNKSDPELFQQMLK